MLDQCGLVKVIPAVLLKAPGLTMIVAVPPSLLSVNELALRESMQATPFPFLAGVGIAHSEADGLGVELAG